MNKRATLIALLAVALVQIAVPSMKVARREVVLREGIPFRFAARPVDPYDPFRGRYLAVNLEPLETKWDNSAGPPARCYVILEAGEDGFARALEASPHKPRGIKTYIKARCRYSYSADNVQVEIPVDRLYVPEPLAPRAEALYREFTASGTGRVVAVVRVLDGLAVLENLLFDDRPLFEQLMSSENRKELPP